MATVPTELRDLAEKLKSGETAAGTITVRELLRWFGAQRRDYSVACNIRKALRDVALQTVPDFESTYIDGDVKIVPASDSQAETSDEKPTGASKLPSQDDSGGGPIIESPEPETSDPTYRINQLPAANRPPVWVMPDTEVRVAVTHMLTKDFSQLPVMQSEREPLGIVSWRSIGRSFVLGRPCKLVRECMEPVVEVASDTSLMAAVRQVTEHECILVRDSTGTISGIVTTSDLSAEFGELAEPFLLLREIENRLRSIIDGAFSAAEIAAILHPRNAKHDVRNAADMTFGEYKRLLENPERWAKIGLAIDHTVFINELERVRTIRNDVMHFDPDPMTPDDIATLRKFVRFFSVLDAVGVI